MIHDGFCHRRDIGDSPAADGHSHGQPEPSSPALSRDNWRQHEAWRAGIDLFNAGYWWEAHEWWEAAWHATDDEDLKPMLQGLIQLQRRGSSSGRATSAAGTACGHGREPI